MYKKTFVNDDFLSKIFVLFVIFQLLPYNSLLIYYICKIFKKISIDQD